MPLPDNISTDDFKDTVQMPRYFPNLIKGVRPEPGVELKSIFPLRSTLMSTFPFVLSLRVPVARAFALAVMRNLITIPPIPVVFVAKW
jgi:hypothetical protein